MGRTVIAVALMLGGMGVAAAEQGAPATRTDMAPAAPTQRAAPDGGKRYEYPPNTGAILRPQDRTPYDVPADRPQSKSTGSVPSDGPRTAPFDKPADAVGR